jgi:hypothetical protein
MLIFGVTPPNPGNPKKGKEGKNGYKLYSDTVYNHPPDSKLISKHTCPLAILDTEFNPPDSQA